MIATMCCSFSAPPMPPPLPAPTVGTERIIEASSGVIHIFTKSAQDTEEEPEEQRRRKRRGRR